MEGVEDASTLHRLVELGCTHAQGRHLAPPWDPATALPPALVPGQATGQHDRGRARAEAQTAAGPPSLLRPNTR